MPLLRVCLSDIAEKRALVRVRGYLLLAVLVGAVLALACASGTPGGTDSTTSSDADDMLVVDCLLPGQVRRLGSQMTYLTARRPIKTSAVDCRIRGGEYTSYDRASYATALSIWLEAAKAGDAEAQNNVGEIFEKGFGLTPDFEAAASWYKQASDQGFGPAQINLGQLYELGRGVPKDTKAALALYRSASGLSKLDFAASVPTQNETQRLKQDLDRREEEIARLREEMQKAERALARPAPSPGSTSATVVPDPGALEAEIVRLKQESDGLRAELAATRPDSGATVPPPTVRLLDPDVPLTRSTRGVRIIQNLAPDTLRLLVGHVDAPAGLVSLTVNDMSVSTEAGGIFRTHIKLHEDGTVVEVVATDRAGHRGSRKFVLEPRADGATSISSSSAISPVPPSPEAKQIDFGRFHALVIGNNDYAKLPRLQTARSDARAISKILQDRFGFRVTTLYDATRYDILSTLNKLRSELTPEDNLIIYYAGHGELDRANSRGHWLPTDAEPESTANWISNVALTDILNAMSARHVMVIADSCYSGALTRSSLSRLSAGSTDEARIAWLKAMANKRSRTALTSGGLAPVLDSGGGEHSIFAKALLDVLSATVEPVEGQRLFQDLSARVAWAAESRQFEQLPQYAPIKFAGHESGDFLLVPRR